jgi:hypothetical protein
MSDTINEMSPDSDVRPLLASEVADMKADDDPSTTGLLLDGGGFVTLIEGNLDALRYFEHSIGAAIVELEQRLFEQRTAWRRGEHVRVGNGRKEWVIKRFTTMGNSSALYAIVEATDGYTSNSVVTTNLSGWDS